MESQRDQTSEDGVADLSENNFNEASKSDGENYNMQNFSRKEAWGTKNILPVTGSSTYNRNRRRPWVESLVAFADDVSVVGLRYVVRTTSSALRRSIWLLLILTGAGFTTYQIQNRIRHYAKYPVNVVIRAEHNEEMRFPTVTICNENRVFFDRISLLGKYSSHVISTSTGTIFSLLLSLIEVDYTPSVN